VQEILAAEPSTYWVNQYGNPLNAEAYSVTLAAEMLEALDRIDYVFVGVSSAGTITGVSRRIKEALPSCKVIAVDTEGSIIFGGPQMPRWLPGIGASVVPPMLKEAKIDDVVVVTEADSVRACLELWQRHNLFVGGSSGSVYAAVRAYFEGKSFARPPVVATLFADRGERYADTIFNPEWAQQLFDGTLRRSVKMLAAAPVTTEEAPCSSP
jgi:cysteine synthase A